MKASLSSLLSTLPRPATPVWPDGVPFVEALRHASMSVELFAPRGTDRQAPHDQDELYFVVTGKAEFVREGDRDPVCAGDVLFVPAGESHRFEKLSDDFVAWVVFWGPKGGER